MDRVALNSFVKELLRAHLKDIKFKVKGDTKAYMIKIATDGYELAKGGKTLKTIFKELGNSDLLPKYEFTLDENDLKQYKSTIEAMKKIALPSVVKSKPSETAHYVLISI